MQEQAAEVIENLIRAQNSPFADVKRKRYEGHHHLDGKHAHSSPHDARRSIDLPLSVVEGTRSWALHVAEKTSLQAEAACTAAKGLIAHAKWEPEWALRGIMGGQLPSGEGGGYERFDSASSLEQRLAVVSKVLTQNPRPQTPKLQTPNATAHEHWTCTTNSPNLRPRSKKAQDKCPPQNTQVLLLAGGMQRGLEAGDTYMNAPQPDHLYGLASAEHQVHKEETAKNLMSLAHTVQVPLVHALAGQGLDSPCSQGLSDH